MKRNAGFTRGTKKLGRSSRGFTLIELLVSMAIFMLISGIAFRLFFQQQSSAQLTRDQMGLNMALRNAVAQMQLDISNAGSGYFQGVNIPSWPVGATIINHVVASGTSCYDSTAGTYGSSCFDQINVISAADPTTYPPVQPTDSTGGSSPTANCSDTSTGVAYAQPAVVSGTAWTLAATANEFKRGDQLLLLNSTGTKLTSVVLTADAAVVGSAVKFQFNATHADGTNVMANDPLDITACDSTNSGNLTPCPIATKFGTQFCAADYVIKLAPITYQVCAGPGSASPCDTSTTSDDIADPKLKRIQNGTANTVMEQVIGFKVGAAIFNTASDSSSTQYNYDSSTYTNSTANDSAYNFTMVRSIRASIIARTTPNTSATYTFRNTFDGGPYQVQGMAVVVNPRNMSMND